MPKTHNGKNKSLRRQKMEAKKQQQIDKASSMEENTSRLRLGEIGTSGMATIGSYIDLILPYELGSYERRMKTFDKMGQNSAVSTALDNNYILVEKAFSSFNVQYNKFSPQSKEAAAFVEYNFNNLKGQTLRQVVRNAISFKKYGFSIMEKTYESITQGQYQGKHKYKIKNIPFRPQLSLDSSIPFEISTDGRKILYARQNTTYFENNIGMKSGDGAEPYKEIPRNKFMLFGYNATDSNPFGESPLVGCFRDVKEMDIVSEYQVVGVTRDMGGMLVFGIPSEILNKAAADPSGPEAQSIERLETQGALCHAGEQTSMIIPQELLEGSTSQNAYSLKLMGVEGGGKMYDTSEIIKDKRKSIFDRFGAGHLLMGDGGGGSYALIDGKSSHSLHYIMRDVEVILEVINNDLIPQLLSLNGIKLSDEDMPKLQAGDIEPLSLDEVSKAGQRLGAVGLLPKADPKFLNELYASAGYEYRFDEGISEDEVMAKLGQETSRSGDGMSSGMPSGVGSATGGGDKSASNAEGISKGVLRQDAKGHYWLDQSTGKRTYTTLEALGDVLREAYE